MEEKIAIYIHWPFCLSLCPYCDFNSHLESNIDHQSWASSYLKELEYFLPQIKNKRIGSVFFGGGTPSLMEASTVEKIMDFLAKYCDLRSGAEVTLEANPTSVESNKFKNFKQAGINRLSLGIQSFLPEDLKILGRKHTANEAIDAIKIASSIFDNYSFDLIYARPNQTLDSWKSELNFALEFGAKHLSLYQLTIEKGTVFYKLFKDGVLKSLDNELSADLYELTNSLMKNKHYIRYEISNYAKANFECRHNINYWEYNSYLGIGPGAHSRINKKAIMMAHSPKKWMEQVNAKGHGIQKEGDLTEEEFIKEIIMMGLRLSKGISAPEFSKKTGKNFIDSVNRDYLSMLLEEGVMKSKDDFYFLSEHGLNLHNYILTRLF